jgi:hypothetical protein
VEEGNPRARALYERLGYVACGREPESWDEEGPDGSVRHYETAVTLSARSCPSQGPARASSADRHCSACRTWLKVKMCSPATADSGAASAVPARSSSRSGL